MSDVRDGPGAVPEVRKVVTVLFCDLAGYTSRSESLDPEALRHVQSKYFADARVALERHGATVEKFIGDAVMAVFGIPRVYEDDALRAVLAADELRRAVASLGLEARIGVNTGEVVAGGGEALVTGDAVNVAARLEQAAPAGEILLGETTFRLVREAVEVEAVEPLALKGKAKPVPAHRLVRVQEGAPGFTRRLDSPLVGRRQELARLRSSLGRAVEQRRCMLVTALGSPGIGKTRLAREFVATVDEATALTGRCLPYGEGITYAPLTEIFQAARADDELATALSSDAPEEISWKVRKSFEHRARERPLVLVVEDIHWAEPTLLDLIEYLTDWTRDAPLLLLCLARPDLLDVRPGWGGGRDNAETIPLEPLTDEEAQSLIETLGETHLDEDARSRIRQTAGGNPLFVEQLVAMLSESETPAGIPPTIQALLGARLDGLPEEQRALLERASVIGIEFDWEDLRVLAADARRPAGGSLSALVRKELIRLHESQEDAFVFRHMLIREAAYERVPKALRAELHERFARHLERTASDADELIGYHLEHAHVHRQELGAKDQGELAAAAAAYLSRAARRALARSDMPASIGLLTRACALMPEGDPERLRFLSDLGSSLGEAGRLDEAVSVLAEAMQEARVAGNLVGEGLARIEALLLRLGNDPAVTADDGAALVRELVPIFERLGDHEALARAWRLSGFVSLMRSRSREQEEAMARSLEHARRAGDGRAQGVALFFLHDALVFGPKPAEGAIRECEALREEAAEGLSGEAGASQALGMLYAMVGRGDDARETMRRGRAIYSELGLQVLWAAGAIGHGLGELYLGDPREAERTLKEASDALERLGERGYRSTVAAVLAQALNEQGRHVEAERQARLSAELASVDDTPSQVLWRTHLARALAYRGELEEAEQLAREAVELAAPTDGPDMKGECAFTLADVLRLSGRNAEAAEEATRALQLWESKGIVRYVERARTLLAELR